MAAEVNGLKNVEFVCGDLIAAVRKVLEENSDQKIIVIFNTDHIARNG